MRRLTAIILSATLVFSAFHDSLAYEYWKVDRASFASSPRFAEQAFAARLLFTHFSREWPRQFGHFRSSLFAMRARTFFAIPAIEILWANPSIAAPVHLLAPGRAETSILIIQAHVSIWQ